MHLLKIDGNCNFGQADPYILKSGERYYIYVTGHDAIYAYHSDHLLEGWQYHGQVLSVPGLHAYWAPSVIELDGKFISIALGEVCGNTLICHVENVIGKIGSKGNFCIHSAGIPHHFR